MNLCRDCRWAEDRGATLLTHHAYDWICRHPASQRMPPPDYVTGAPQDPRTTDCVGMRQDWAGACGPQGRYWEAKEIR
jgi:hypothetical protein